MIIVEINGGFGNQLFQYANAWVIAKKTGQELCLDLSMYRYGCGREFQLDKLNIDTYKTKIFFTKRQKNKLIRVLVKGTEEILKALKLITYIKIQDEDMFCSPDVDTKRNIYLSGYWISHKYFEKYAKDVKKLFCLKDSSDELKNFKKNISDKNSVAIHIRRGDYVDLGLCLTDTYYHEAIDLMENEIVGDKHYYIFSDDVEFAREFLKSRLDINRVTFVKDEYKLSDVEEVYAIAACKNQIIANSTFSWWGAWLNDNPHKVVVAPCTTDWEYERIPETWKVIEC